MSLSKLTRLLSRRVIAPNTVPKAAPHTAAAHVADERYVPSKEDSAKYMKPSERLAFDNTEEIFKPKVAPQTAAAHVADGRYVPPKPDSVPYANPSEQLTFDNTEQIFKHKSNWGLIRALVVLRLCSIEVLVRNNQTLLSLMRKTLGKRLFDRILKATFFGHFVAGETKDEVKVTAEKLRRSGIDPIIDYSIEANVTVDEVQGALTGVTNELPEVILIPPHVNIRDVETIHQNYTPHEGYYTPSYSEKKRVRSRSPSRRLKRSG